ncbi:hypothetical protein [Polaromonas sp. CG9_12]|nr:hypothetical protein [Polaromonas sp. CG9_12]
MSYRISRDAIEDFALQHWPRLAEPSGVPVTGRCLMPKSAHPVNFSDAMPVLNSMGFIGTAGAGKPSCAARQSYREGSSQETQKIVR